jgi:hypothetical protein
MRSPSFSFSFLIFTLSCIACLLHSCSGEEKKSGQLAKTYCSSCHLFPEPHLLDKKTWEQSVLPRMGVQLGLNTFNYQNDVPINDLTTFIATLPYQPVVSEKQWKQIVDYYTANAPDSLTIQTRDQPGELTQFEITSFRFGGKDLPMITMLLADTLHHRIFAGTRQSWLYQLNDRFEITDSAFMQSPPAHLNLSENGKLQVLLMGIMDPNDQPKGMLAEIDFKNKTADVLLDSLKRPVFFERADLNDDGLDEYIVCAFGNYTGALLLYENQGNRQYKKTILNPQPGTRNVIVKDFNSDGRKDILALVSQADEKVMLFINEGKMHFNPITLLRFPSVYGSSFLEVADMNQDGHFDLVCTNGDNADFSVILKPYHGVRIFLNDGKNNFSETWFYPMHGASEVKARDFDGDGDTDLAVVAFFPDFKNNPLGFAYFENTGTGFTPFTTPLQLNGRWLKLEAADIDQDGDQDILLGALGFPALVPDSLYQQWRQARTGILILRNTLK